MSSYLKLVTAAILLAPMVSNALEFKFEISSQSGSALRENVPIDIGDLPKEAQENLRNCQNDFMFFEVFEQDEHIEEMTLTVHLDAEIENEEIKDITIEQIHSQTSIIETLPGDESFEQTYWNRGVLGRLYGATIGNSGSSAGHCDDVSQRLVGDLRNAIISGRSKLRRLKDPETVRRALKKIEK